MYYTAHSFVPWDSVASSTFPESCSSLHVSWGYVSLIQKGNPEAMRCHSHAPHGAPTPAVTTGLLCLGLPLLGIP